MPSATSAMPKLRSGATLTSTPRSRSFSKIWKIVKPKPISDSEVRITDMSVRSALIRVRWNDSSVRRMDSSVRCSDSAVRWVDNRVRCCESWTEAWPGFDSSTAGTGGSAASSNALRECAAAADAPSGKRFRASLISRPLVHHAPASEPDRHADHPPARARVVDEPIVVVPEVDVELPVAGQQGGAGCDLVSDQSDELPREFGADAEPAEIAARAELPAPSGPRQRARPDDRAGPQLAYPQRQLGEHRVRGMEGEGRAQVPEP